MSTPAPRPRMSQALLQDLARTQPPPSPPRFTEWVKMSPQAHPVATPMENEFYQRLEPAERDRYNLDRLHTHGQITALVTPQMRHAISAIETTLTDVVTNHSHVAHHGLFLTGPAQAGKSTILITAAQEIEKELRNLKGLPLTNPDKPPRDPSGALYIPVAYALCANSVGGTLTNILSFYGEEPKNMRIPEMENRVSFLFRTCQTRILILDQAQELTDTKTNMSKQSAFLKSLLDSNVGLTILGAGIDLHNVALFQPSSSPQLRQAAYRFLLHEVQPYPTQNPEDVAPLLTALEKRLILLHHPPGTLATLAPDVLQLTRGITGLIISLIRQAAALAITSGEERITKQTLRKANRLPIQPLKVVP